MRRPWRRCGGVRRKSPSSPARATKRCSAYADGGEWGAVTRLRLRAGAALRRRRAASRRSRPRLPECRGLCSSSSRGSRTGGACVVSSRIPARRPPRSRPRTRSSASATTAPARIAPGSAAVHAAIYALSNMGSVDVWLERFVALAPRVSAISVRRHRAKPRSPRASSRSPCARRITPISAKRSRTRNGCSESPRRRRVCAPRSASFC